MRIDFASCVKNHFHLLALTLCLFYVGCGSGENVSIQVPTSSGPVILKVGMAQAEVKSRLGEPDLKLGTSYNYEKLGISLTFSKENKVSGIFAGHASDEEYADNFKGETESGIMLGHSDLIIKEKYGDQDPVVFDEKKTKSIMKEHFGEEDFKPDTGQLAILNYYKAGYRFTLRNGKLVHIILRAGR